MTASSINLKRIFTRIFLTLLFFTGIWIGAEYYFASEDHTGYYHVNVKIPRPELADKLFNYLAERVNVSVELAKELHRNGYVTYPSNSDTIANTIKHIETTFESVFIKLKDIPRSTRNTFFIESKCATEEMTKSYNITYNFILSARQCCSIESAARTNPRREIYILHTCPLSDDFLLRAPMYVRRLLLDHTNVHVVRYNRTDMFAGTPVEKLWNSKRIDESEYPVEHSSDILRLTLLWRFGGMYCDLDVITIRPVRRLKTNYCALESDRLIGNAILNFEPYRHGHYILTKALRRLNTHFNGEIWTANGPDLVTDIMLRVCNTTVLQHLLNCTSFKIYHRDILYPLYWKDHKTIFDYDFGEEIVHRLKKTGFTVHFWNKYTYKYTVKIGSPQAYSLLAQEFCPDVSNNCGQTF